MPRGAGAESRERMLLRPTRHAVRMLQPLQPSRGFRNVSAGKRPSKETDKKHDGTGRDPYAIFKNAIAAEPDAKLVAELPPQPTAAEGHAERSRLRMLEVHIQQQRPQQPPPPIHLPHRNIGHYLPRPMRAHALPPYSQEHRANGHLSRLIRLRQRVCRCRCVCHTSHTPHTEQTAAPCRQATDALPAELKEEACVRDVSLFPVHRRVPTETPPIADFQQKVRQRR